MAKAGIRRIALFAPRSNPLYQEMLWGLRRAFAVRDVECLINWPLLDEHDLAAFCEQGKPDAVIEIDRSRAQGGGVPKSTLHVAWVQNPRCYHQLVSRGFGASELVYFMGAPQSFGFDPRAMNGSKVGCLLPAIETAEMSMDVARRPIDMAYLGAITRPDFNGLLSTNFNLGGRPLRSADIIAALLESGVSPSRDGLVAQHDAIRAAFAMASGEPAAAFKDVLDGRGMILFDHDVLPSIERERLLASVLDLDAELALYGNGAWRDWPRYAARYHGPLGRAGDVRRAFAGCRMVLGVGPRPLHPRQLVAMATGAVLATNRTVFDEEETGVARHFEAGVHYLDYDIDDAGGALTEALADRERLNQIAGAAIEELRARHCWIHRVDQILADLGGL